MNIAFLKAIPFLGAGGLPTSNTVEPQATLLQPLGKEAILSYFCHWGNVAQIVAISLMVGFGGTSWKERGRTKV